MITTQSRQYWKNLFFFSLGLTLAATFCMKMIESDFIGFSILGLEFFYDQERMTTIFASMDPRQSQLLRYVLLFDFAFMAGIFPLIASMCMLGTFRAGAKNRKLLLSLAVLQLVAWGLDVIENLHLLKWNRGAAISNLGIFHIIVWTKWILAITGLVVSLVFLFRGKGRTVE